MRYNLLNHQFSTEKLSKEQINVLNDFDKIVQGVKPLNSKQLMFLPDNIRELSHQLTDQRSSRRLGYMNENVQLSAYVRYYTWWNLVRLTRLFSNLSADSFPSEDGFCIDLGTGPLTVISALWIARPELRNLKLTWYCLDVSQGAMALGEDIFMSIAAKFPAQNEESHWKIIRVKGSFGTSIREKCSFVTCANMFNELDQSSQMPPEFQTKKYYEQLSNYGSKDAKFLLIEPGVPKAARTLSLLRDRFIKSGYSVNAPCPHCGDCPMNGFKSYTGSKNKWCNFAFSTEDAPQKLQKLSTQAKLPKERAVLSFISVSKAKIETPSIAVRITSDPFRLPKNRTGFYACSQLGLTLVATTKPEKLSSGDLLQVEIKQDISKLPEDFKSGAKILILD